MNEEEKEQLKLLIEEYEESYKQSKYEGNIEEYEYLKETHKLLKDTLNYIDKLQNAVEFQKNQKKFWRNEYYQKRKQIREIVEKMYNDIDYFDRDIRKDVEDLLKEN